MIFKYRDLGDGHFYWDWRKILQAIEAVLFLIGIIVAICILINS